MEIKKVDEAVAEVVLRGQEIKVVQVLFRGYRSRLSGPKPSREIREDATMRHRQRVIGAAGTILNDRELHEIVIRGRDLPVFYDVLTDLVQADRTDTVPEFTHSYYRGP